MKGIAFLWIVGCALMASAHVRPDVVFILVDSLRASHVGCYGYTRRTTPWIDAFAAESVRFETVISAGSWTQPSVMSFFTSVPPDVHRRVLPEQPHDASLTTLAEALRAAGYRTVGVTANSMTARRFGFGKGFDVWDASPATAWADLPGATEGCSAADGAVMTRLGLSRWRDAPPETPLFLFLFYMDSHWDFRPPAPYNRLFSDDGLSPPQGSYGWPAERATPLVRRRAVDAYDGEIAFCDHALSNLVTRILGTERGRQAMIVLASDHGEGFWERGFAGHGNSLSDDELRVPLLIRPPLAQSAGFTNRMVKGVIGTIDVAPTILDLAGLPIPASWQGRSLVSAMRAGHSDARPVVSETRIAPRYGWLRSVRTDRWKIVAQAPFEHTMQVYDLASDPGETTNRMDAEGPLPSEVTALLPLLRPASWEHSSVQP